jgi:streptomycin 6-kinase
MEDVALEVADRWSLTLGEPYEQGVGGHTTRATLADGTPVVLKLVHPHRESEHEADALRAWDGDGAVRLFAQDGDALLLERCEPGTPSRPGQEAALERADRIAAAAVAAYW